jgi:hypothetical protein
MTAESAAYIVDECRRAWDTAAQIDRQASSLPPEIRSEVSEAAFRLRGAIDHRYSEGRLHGSLADTPSAHLHAPVSRDPVYLAGYGHALLVVAGAYPY